MRATLREVTPRQNVPPRTGRVSLVTLRAGWYAEGRPAAADRPTIGAAGVRQRRTVPSPSVYVVVPSVTTPSVAVPAGTAATRSSRTRLST